MANGRQSLFLPVVPLFLPVVPYKQQTLNLATVYKTVNSILAQNPRLGLGLDTGPFDIAVGLGFLILVSYVLVGSSASTRGNQTPDNDILLEAAQMIDFALNSGFGQHSGRLLEGCGRNKAVGTQTGAGYAQQDRLAGRRIAALGDDLVVFLLLTGGSPGSCGATDAEKSLQEARPFFSDVTPRQTKKMTSFAEG